MSALDDVVKFFLSKTSGTPPKKILNPKDSTIVGWVDRQRVYFIRVRAQLLFFVVPALTTDQLQKRLGAEFDAIEAFLAANLGTFDKPGPLVPAMGGNGSLDKTPKTLDLADLAYRRTADTGKVVKSRAWLMSVGRRVKVKGIVWRAAASTASIWTDPPDAAHLAATLAPGILDELLDRRLRTVERMQYQVSDTTGEADDDPLGAGGLGPRKWMSDWGSGVRGPWIDGFRIRLFEYPRINANTTALQQRVDPKNAGYIADPGTSNFLDHSHDDPSDVGSMPASSHRHWAWHNSAKTRLAWRVVHGTADASKPSAAEWRFPSALHDDYRADTPNQYLVDVVPKSRTGAAAIDALFDHTRPASTGSSKAVADIWERSWLWCDHVIAAIHLDALLFGLRRRFGVTKGEGTFNDLVAGNNLPAGALKPYVTLRAAIGVLDPNQERTLFTDPDSRHFRTTLTSIDSLQIGDHVVFWNHFLYSVLAIGDWRLENSLVIALDTDSDTGRTKPSTIRMQGHGTDVRNYGAYQQLIATMMGTGLQEAQRMVIKAMTAPGPHTTALPFRGTQLVEWTPYSPVTRLVSGGSVVNVNPWWIVVDPNVSEIGQGALTNADYARAISALMPKTVTENSTPATGYRTPPLRDMIFFPLFEPRFAVDLKSTGGGKPTKLSGWDAYLVWHEAKSALNKPPAKPPTQMDLVTMSGELVPGLFLRPDKMFSVIQAIPSR